MWDNCSDLDKITFKKRKLRAARIVAETEKGTSSDLLYSQTKWLKLEERLHRFKLCFMHKLFPETAPDYYTAKYCQC